MKISSMEHFLGICKDKFVQWHNNVYQEDIHRVDVNIVWNCKTLQNYKCILSYLGNYNGDETGKYVLLAEYSYNGDKQEIYEDVYRKVSNRCIKEEE